MPVRRGHKAPNIREAGVIAVQGVEGRTVAVLGLGRSGTATVRALEAGGARAVAWDDGAPARA